MDEGFTFVSIDRALSIIDSGSNEKFALITFDDVPYDMFENGYPLLKQMNLPFTVFVTVRSIDKNGFLSSEQLSVLNAEPLCTIGAHTLTHPQLRYAKNAYEEICRSKSELENIIGKKVDYFAYPFGRVSTISRKNIACVKRAGYKCAFSTISSDISDYTSKYRWFLPRVVINK
ncbi:MAG: polysaccharide deacetylase family protein [Muribaculaceae bacterium]